MGCHYRHARVRRCYYFYFSALYFDLMVTPCSSEIIEMSGTRVAPDQILLMFDFLASLNQVENAYGTRRACLSRPSTYMKRYVMISSGRPYLLYTSAFIWHGRPSRSLIHIITLWYAKSVDYADGDDEIRYAFTMRVDIGARSLIHATATAYIIDSERQT